MNLNGAVTAFWAVFVPPLLTVSYLAQKVPDDSDIAGVAAAFSQSLRAFMEERSVSGGGLTCPVTFLGVSPPGGASADAGMGTPLLTLLR